MKLKDLNKNPANPRKIKDEKLKALARSLKEFGDLSGIVFNKRTNRLVGGHQRVTVLPADAEIRDGFIWVEGDKFTYREVDWDETKEKAANLAANRHGGEWDIPKLSDWLIELDSMNMDMELIGFTQEEMEGILAPTNFPPGSEDDQGKLDEKKPITCPKCGEVFVTP